MAGPREKGSGPAGQVTSRLLALVFAEILEIGIDDLVIHVARAFVAWSAPRNER